MESYIVHVFTSLSISIISLIISAFITIMIIPIKRKIDNIEKKISYIHEQISGREGYVQKHQDNLQLYNETLKKLEKEVEMFVNDYREVKIALKVIVPELSNVEKPIDNNIKKI